MLVSAIRQAKPEKLRIMRKTICIALAALMALVDSLGFAMEALMDECE